MVSSCSFRRPAGIFHAVSSHHASHAVCGSPTGMARDDPAPHDACPMMSPVGIKRVGEIVRRPTVVAKMEFRWEESYSRLEQTQASAVDWRQVDLAVASLHALDCPTMVATARRQLLMRSHDTNNGSTASIVRCSWT